MVRRLALILALLACVAEAGLCPTPASAGAAPALQDLPADPDNTLYLDLTYGRVVIRMRPDLAPNHVARIKHLVRNGFFDGLAFYRVIEHFVAQTGDPSGNNTGGTGRTLKAEFSKTPQLRGIVSMARAAGRNSADSEWFIVLEDNREKLDGQYTVWGQVTSGMEFVDMIHKGDTRKEGHVTDPDRVIRLQVASDADQTTKRNPADLLKALGAAAAAQNFSATEFRCVALGSGLGITQQATLAAVWAHGFLAGHYKAQNALAFAETATQDTFDKELGDVCATFQGAYLHAAVYQKLADTVRPLPPEAMTLPLDTFTCSDYTAARKSGDTAQADVADLWAFAFIQGYKSVSQPDLQIPFDGRVKILAAEAAACEKNAGTEFLDLTALVAAKVKIK